MIVLVHHHYIALKRACSRRALPSCLLYVTVCFLRARHAKPHPTRHLCGTMKSAFSMTATFSPHPDNYYNIVFQCKPVLLVCLFCLEEDEMEF